MYLLINHDDLKLVKSKSEMVEQKKANANKTTKTLRKANVLNMLKVNLGM
jgi:hypothetical protein